VAVLGVGLEVALRTRAKWLQKFRSGGGVLVSEFASTDGGGDGHFPQRNKTIAALSDACVLVRGETRSGSLHTFEAARRLGRPCFAIPGEPADAQSYAPNFVLCEGGRATLEGREVLSALGLGEGAVLPAESAAPVLPEGSDPLLVRVLEALSPVPRHVDELAARLSLPPAELGAALLQLELAGVAKLRPGNLYSWS